jgi:hypothetical protein
LQFIGIDRWFSSGGGSVITREYNASTAAIARTSPFLAFCVSDLIKARCLLTVRECPCSRTVTFSPSSALRSVARFRLPRERPCGQLPGRYLVTGDAVGFTDYTNNWCSDLVDVR